MSEPTYPGDTPEQGPWSRVYTGLDWVARWMADRGYTDAEIAYVVGAPVVPAVPVEAVEAVEAVAPVEGQVEPPVDEPVELPVETPEVDADEQPVWTVPLGGVDAAVAQDETEQSPDTDCPESATA